MEKINYILVTGGLGFIGSHVVVKLIELNYNVVVYDNLFNSGIDIINKINKITNKPKNIKFVKGDIRNIDELTKLFTIYNISHVFHFAALKSVSESEKYPELYYEVNVKGTKNLLHIMNTFNCKNFIYSSSATVYGDSPAPTTENSIVGKNLACNYAQNKYEMEQYILQNHNNGFLQNWNIIILRYFNPIGAHFSGIIGENTNGIPNNVFPYLLRVAKWTNDNSVDKDMESPYKIFTIYGDDYNTRDGTCIRDYIHIDDLAKAHIEVLQLLKNKNIRVYNVGTGRGSTVMELVQSINKILELKGKKKIAYKIGNRREGDIDISYSKVDKIYNDIGFTTSKYLDDMCIDGLNFIGL